MHVLIVEDDTRSQRLFRDLLELDGYTVSVAGTVPEGRAALAAVPDLIVMDIRLPGGDGQVLLDEVRADPALAATRVLAVTAFAMQGDRPRFLQQGFDGYLSKPVSVVGFRRIVAELLGVSDG